MKYKLIILSVLVAICSIAMNAIGQNSKSGVAVFENTCSGCHSNGNNTIDPSKSLKSAALKENAINGVADIKKRVQEGKGAMPAYKSSLKPAEIDAVANYVWSQAQNNWK